MLYTLEILDDEDKNIEYLARFFDSQDVRKAHFSRPGKIMPDWWQEFEEKVGYTWPKKERRDAASRVSNRLTTFYKDTIIRPFVIGDDEFQVFLYVLGGDFPVELVPQEQPVGDHGGVIFRFDGLVKVGRAVGHPFL